MGKSGEKNIVLQSKIKKISLIWTFPCVSNIKMSNNDQKNLQALYENLSLGGDSMGNSPDSEEHNEFDSSEAMESPSARQELLNHFQNELDIPEDVNVDDVVEYLTNKGVKIKPQNDEEESAFKDAQHDDLFDGDSSSMDDELGF